MFSLLNLFVYNWKGCLHVLAGLIDCLVSTALKPPGAIFLDFFPGKFYLREILRGCRQATILLAWKGTQGMGGGVLPLCCPLKLTLCAKHEGVTPLRQTFCKQTCLLTIGKGAFMSWLVKSTGVGCVKTSWYYFPGFFVLENFTLWRFYVADASRFY